MHEIQRVGVIGAGTMGHGIAQVSAMAGYSVVLLDATVELTDKGVDRIKANLDDGVKRGKLSEADRDAALSRITATTEYDDFADVDLAIEAVPEKPEIKHAVLDQLRFRMHGEAIVATNTSSLSITDLASKARNPAAFVGLHFFNPVHINKLLEIVRGKTTSDAVIEASLEYAKRIGKEAIVVKDSPGFATSRLGVLLGLEAIRMVEQGVASAEDIDKAMELGYKHPMGPLKLTDLVGLDVRLDIARYLHEKLGAEQFRPPRLLEQMVAEGKLGKKTGRGFHDWSNPS